MKRKLTRNEKRNPIYKFLDNAGVRVDSLTSSGGRYTMQKNFTFDSGSTSQELAKKVENAVPGSVILRYDSEIGTASQPSNFRVMFKIVKKGEVKA